MILPATCLYVLKIWLAETRRVRRASNYLWYLEKKLGAIPSLAPQPLEWEGQIRKKGSQSLFTEHYAHTVAYFCGVRALNVGIGTYVLIEFILNAFGNAQTPPSGAAVALSFAVAIIFGQRAYERHKKQADWLIEEFDKEPTFPRSSS